MFSRRLNWTPLLLLWLILLPGLLLAQDRQLTLDDIYDPIKKKDFGGYQLTDPSWQKNGTHFLHFPPGRVPVRVEAHSGVEEPLVKPEHLKAEFSRVLRSADTGAGDVLASAKYVLSPTEKGLLILCLDDLFYFQFKGGELRRLTHDPTEEREPLFSPSGEYVAFIRGYDLHVVDVEQGREKALTSGGSETLLNGLLDWVYQEEIYGRGKFRGFWWSPDSSRLAFLQLDQTQVPEVSLVDYLSLHLNLETYRYPKAGDPNPGVRLGVVSLESSQVNWLDVAPDSAGQEILIVRVSWSPEGRAVICHVQNREQTWLELVRADASGGNKKTLIREESGAWINRLENPIWMEDQSFLWLSERTGYQHVYRYSKQGRLLGAVTEGEWEVREVVAVDERKGLLYFTGTKDSVLEQQLYRIRLDGAAVTKVSTEAGTHKPNFNTDATLFLDTYSDISTPPRTDLYRSDGSRVRVVEKNEVPVLREYRLSDPEFVQFKTRDGLLIDAMLLKPPDFDPSTRYPVLLNTYSGPHGPEVLNRWRGSGHMWHQMLASEGYLVWVCHSRTYSGKGVGVAWPAHKDLGRLELRDLEDSLTWLKSKSYVDGSRIGIFGWSYGGYMVAYALTHSSSFKVGISGAPVTDWTLYDSVYTERFMGLPRENEEGYERSSALRSAENLSGKLLLIHGTMDDNVHMQNSMKFAHALQKAGKEFELMLYPASRHGVRDDQQVKHLRTLITQFIRDNL
jgi:dipeptidyl-peptidase-4